MAGADRQADDDGRFAQGGSDAERDEAVREAPAAERDPAAREVPGPEPDPEAEAAELIAQLRQLAGPDPATIRTVVSDVLAALDRVSGGALREQLPRDSELLRDAPPTPPGPAERDAPGGWRVDSAGDPATGAGVTNGYPVEPHPAQPQPPSPHPAQPQPGEPHPGRPGPAAPHPAQPQPTGPHPVEPHPTDPHPVEPHPTDPHPAEPGPLTPGPVRRSPAQRGRPQQRNGEDRT